MSTPKLTGDANCSATDRQSTSGIGSQIDDSMPDVHFCPADCLFEGVSAKPSARWRCRGRRLIGGRRQVCRRGCRGAVSTRGRQAIARLRCALVVPASKMGGRQPADPRRSRRAPEARRSLTVAFVTHKIDRSVHSLPGRAIPASSTVNASATTAVPRIVDHSFHHLDTKEERR